MIQENKLKIDHYIIERTLGVGGFGKVKLARHEFTGSEVAIKIINKKKMKSDKMSSKIQREIRLLKYFSHPNMIKLYQVLDTDLNIYLVMEYVSGGELFNLVNEEEGLQEDDARRLFKQICSGIEYCHENLVAHRDLKLENILVDD
jgi:5'-AMP-activated protein kinase, catalytic alpha subunit